jgi:hypothetical protein
MRRRWLTMFTAMFIAATALASCEQGARSPGDSLTAPAAPAASVAAGLYELVRLPSVQLFSTIEEASLLIGVRGGELRVGPHTLAVPQGAVTVPTEFTVRIVRNGYIEIEASAIAERLIGGPLDRGRQGFSRPVTLTLSYEGAANIPADPSRLLIVRKLGGYAGPFEPVPSTVDPVRRLVAARLDHFSGYMMAVN